MDHLSRALFAACLLFAAWHLLRVATAPLSVIVQYVPDDAFYYLEIAPNLGLLGKSSFDAGQTPTTGYHPLWAWIAEVCGWLGGYERMPMLRMMIAVSGLLALGTAAVAGRLAWRQTRTTLPVITVLLTSFSFLNNSGAAMEWSLVVAISAAVAWMLLGAPPVPSKLRYSVLVVLGTLGSLARIDFGGQAVGYLAAALLLWLLHRQRQYVAPALSLCAGASAGLAMAILRDHHIAGQWLQASAHIKALWGLAWGISPLPVFLVMIRTLLYIPGSHRSVVAQWAHSLSVYRIAWLYVPGLLVAGGCGVGWLNRSFSRPGIGRGAPGLEPVRGLFAGVSATLALTTYAIVYSFNSSSTQCWYTAQITLPIGLLLTLAVFRARRAGQSMPMLLALSGLSVANLMLFALSPPIAFEQQRILAEAQQASAAFGHASVGVSDTGIFNFVYGGRVVNLDGLANDEIVAYAPDRLPCYLADKRIEYANGFGGFSTSVFHPRPMTEYAEPVWIAVAPGEQVEFFRIDWAKVRALPECGQAQN